MSEQMNKSGLSLLNKFGLALDTEIEGMLVTDVKATNRKNTFQFVIAKDKEDKAPRKVFVGKKTIEENLMREDGDAVFIAPGFETYTNNEGEIWIRNKATALAKLEVIS